MQIFSFRFYRAVFIGVFFFGAMADDEVSVQSLPMKPVNEAAKEKQ